MTDRLTDVIDHLETGGKQTAALFRSLTAEQLTTPVYTGDMTWTARQVLAHLATIERSMHWLFGNILEGGSGTPDDFDLERFNRSQPAKLDDLPIEEVIAQFQAARAETSAIVRGMQDSDLDRTGRHPFHGHDRLEVFIRWAYEHAALHEADVRQAVGVGE